jgi:3-hydroxyacyl-CoA dehydrogenase
MMIKRAAIIGLGTMGRGIAARLARGGLKVRAYDISHAADERARQGERARKLVAVRRSLESQE